MLGNFDCDYDKSKIKKGEKSMNKSIGFFLFIACIVTIYGCVTPTIHGATGYQNYNEVKSFIGQGVSVNALDRHGNTPLNLASQNGNLAISKLLLDYDADPNLQNSEGWYPMLYAAYLDYYALMKILLQHGSELNKQNRDGWSPLLYAVYYGRDRIAIDLIKAGADVNLINNQGYNALYYAEQYQHNEVAKALKKKGAKLPY